MFVKKYITIIFPVAIKTLTFFVCITEELCIFQTMIVCSFIDRNQFLSAIRLNFQCAFISNYLNHSQQSQWHSSVSSLIMLDYTIETKFIQFLLLQCLYLTVEFLLHTLQHNTNTSCSIFLKTFEILLSRHSLLANFGGCITFVFNSSFLSFFC